MIDMKLRISFDDLLKLLNQLDPEQKRQVRERLDEDWATRFGQALDEIHADISNTVSPDEAEDDIERAIREVRDQA